MWQVGTSIPGLGTAKLKVQRGSFTCLLLCRLLESKHCRPILGKTACEGMGVVDIRDSDAIKRPDTSGCEVFSVQAAISGSKILYNYQVVAIFPDVFNDGIGVLEGKYHNRLYGSVKQVQYAPRRGQVALRDEVEETLDESSHQSQNLHPGSLLCWLSPQKMEKFGYALTQRI